VPGNQWQLTIYIPKEKRQDKLMERLRKLAQKQRRTVNFLVIEAILKYLEEAEKDKQ